MATSHDDARPRLLLLGGAGASPLLRDLTHRAVAAARARGMRVHLTDTGQALSAVPEVSELADVVSAVDFNQPEQCVAWSLGRAADGERFDVVLGLREYAQVATAEVATALGIPGNPPDVIRTIRTKDACRRQLAAAGFGQPVFAVCGDAAEAERFIESSSGPWIVKPRDGMGSVGVSRVDGPADLPEALAALPDRDTFLVEHYVAGSEYSVEGVFVGGEPMVLAITEKETLPPPSFVEIGHIQPAPLDVATSQDIGDTVAAALRALGMRFGVFHVELWRTGGGLVLGEVHGRTGGDWIHLLLSHTRGADIYGMVYDDALGRPVEAPPPASRVAAVRFFTPVPGRLLAIEGLGPAIGHPAVIRGELTVGVGDTVRQVNSSEDRAGCLVVSAASATEARELASRLTSSVRFVTRDEAKRVLPYPGRRLPDRSAPDDLGEPAATQAR